MGRYELERHEIIHHAGSISCGDQVISLPVRFPKVQHNGPAVSGYFFYQSDPRAVP